MGAEEDVIMPKSNNNNDEDNDDDKDESPKKRKVLQHPTDMRIVKNSEIDLSKEEEKKGKTKVNELIKIDLTSNNKDSKLESSTETDDENKAAKD
eukprot:6489279-Ditylum_brightwellii.AAC.1